MPVLDLSARIRDIAVTYNILNCNEIFHLLNILFAVCLKEPLACYNFDLINRFWWSSAEMLYKAVTGV